MDSSVINTIINDAQKLYYLVTDLMQKPATESPDVTCYLINHYKDDGVYMRICKLKAFDAILSIERPSWQIKYNQLFSRVFLHLIVADKVFII